MTTRRGFIQGVLAGMVALVLPKTAKAMPVDEPVEPEHGLRVDGRDCWTLPEKAATSEGVFMMPAEIPSGWEPLLMIPTCARPASKLYHGGYYMVIDDDDEFTCPNSEIVGLATSLSATWRE